MSQASPSFAPHSRRSQRARLSALGAVLVTTLAGTSRAEDAAENVAAARTLGSQGVELADAGKCPEAIEKLKRAEALHHAPTILGRLGECQVNVGEVVEGTENLNLVVREPLAETAPKVFKDAQARAQKVLTTATPKIAHLLIRVTPADVKASVAVAGKPVPDALLGAERPTDPGTHQVTATAAGYQTATATVTLVEGGHQDITLFLEKDPNALAAVPPGSPSTQPATVTKEASPGTAPAPRSNTPAYIAFGVGGAGLLFGSITGALAFSKASDCPNKVCPTQGDLDSAKSMATISTVTFGIGLAGVAVGTVLLLTGKHQEATPAQAKVHTPPKLSVQPWLGVSSLGLVGSFQ